MLFGIVFTAADFAVVYILTHGGPFNSTQVLTTWAYTIGIESGSLGEGAAISLFLFPLLAAVTILMLFFARRAQVVVIGPLRAIWRKAGTWVVVGPFAIVLAFPFYWMLTTMFKRDLDLYNAQSVPYTYNDAQGHAHWDFWNYMTFHHVTFLFKHTKYPTWLVNTAIIGVAVVAITLVLALPAGYALARLSGRWGQTLGVGIFLVYLVPPTLLFLPLSRADRRAEPEGHALVDDPRLPVVHDPVRDVAADGVLQDDPAGARGRRARRRLLAAEGAAEDRLPGLAAGDPDRRHLRVLALRERVHLRVHVHSSTSDERTISAGVPNELIRGDVFFWQSLMAAVLIPSIPLALLYNAFLDRFIKGFTGGAFR